MNNSTPIIALVAVIVGGAIRKAERGIIDALEDAGAVTPETATPLVLTGWLKQMLFGRLKRGGAVGETPQGTLYVNVVGYAAYQHRRRMRALVAIGIVAVIGLYFYYRSRNP